MTDTVYISKLTLTLETRVVYHYIAINVVIIIIIIIIVTILILKSRESLLTTL